ncbi:DUF1064 domain-containing protein [Abyssicoccus albus]|uniref:DUF1064 domain-containing protein n=1 Tax=Abyssicoccus albus TaxID=1817405 RepID=UPI00097E1ECD|nr:DUF1064 domain-containing protein [Abyssicoccus albus]AQL56429.1 hypothetical protein BVH56_05595 [Abyssicoccus albus]
MSKSKYGAKKIIVDGIKFDSKVEASYYKVLKHKQEIGEVKDFELQPEIEIIPSFKYKNRKRRPMVYRMDFKVEYYDGLIVYVDIKGMPTPDAKLKRKLVEHMFRDNELEHIIWLSASIKYGDQYGFIETDELTAIRRKNKRKKRGL